METASKEEARLLRTMNRIATGGKVAPIQLQNEESERNDSSNASKGFETASNKSTTSTWRIKQEQAKKIREEQELQEKLTKERILKQMTKSLSEKREENSEDSPIRSSSSSDDISVSPYKLALKTNGSYEKRNYNSVSSPRSSNSSNSSSPISSPRDPLQNFVSGLIKKEEERRSSGNFNSLGAKSGNSSLQSLLRSPSSDKPAVPSFVTSIWSNPPPKSEELKTEKVEVDSQNKEEDEKEKEPLMTENRQVIEEDKSTNEKEHPVASLNTQNIEKDQNELKEIKKEESETTTIQIEKREERFQNHSEEIKTPTESQENNSIENNNNQIEQTKEEEKKEEEKKESKEEEKITEAEIQQNFQKEERKVETRDRSGTMDVLMDSATEKGEAMRILVFKTRNVISTLVLSLPSQFSRPHFEQSNREFISEFARQLTSLPFSDLQKSELVSLLKSFSQAGKTFLVAYQPELSLEEFNQLTSPVKQQIKAILSYLRNAKQNDSVNENQSWENELEGHFGKVKEMVVEVIQILQQPSYDKQLSTSKITFFISFVRRTISPQIHDQILQKQLVEDLRLLLNAGIEMNVKDGDFNNRNQVVQSFKRTLQTLVSIKHKILPK